VRGAAKPENSGEGAWHCSKIHERRCRANLQDQKGQIFDAQIKFIGRDRAKLQISRGWGCAT